MKALVTARHAASALGRWLPEGRLLGDAEWRVRHRAIVWVLWLHVPALVAFGAARGKGAIHGTAEVAVLGILAWAAARPSASRRIRATVASVGLVTCSALLVHLWDGRTEAHFHFFVIISLLVLYQDWVPFGVALTYVVAHHGVMGVVAPSSVFDRADAVADPWLWAMIHGAFVLAACATNIVAWRAAEQLLHDPLTGLGRRVLLDDRLVCALERARRTRADVAVLFVDLDGFKAVNDSLGHARGDELIAAIGRRLRAACRASETPVRYGGDEFVILCEDLAGAESAGAIAERLAGAIRRPWDAGDRTVTVTCSIGVAVGDGTAGPDDLVQAADAAMYRAKHGGRDAIEVTVVPGPASPPQGRARVPAGAPAA